MIKRFFNYLFRRCCCTTLRKVYYDRNLSALERLDNIHFVYKCNKCGTIYSPYMKIIATDYKGDLE